MTVSFDFDGTLSREFVQSYAKQLITEGHDVWIVTSRFGDDEKYKRFFLTSAGVNLTNSDLFEVADKLGIKRDHIVFTDMQEKWIYFENHPEFVWHLDDDWVENRQILNNTKVKAIDSISSPNWIHKCDKLLKKL